jgi:hypothetical protein
MVCREGLEPLEGGPMALLEFSEAFTKKKAEKLKSVRTRKPLVIRIAEVLAVIYVGLSRYILPVLGLGSLVTAAWTISLPLGLLVLGIALLILDYGRRTE